MHTSSQTLPGPETVNLNFRMSERDRRDLKLWCVENDLTMTEALVGVALLRALRDQFVPARIGTLLDLIGSASVFLVDQARDLRVERRSADSWVVYDGASVVNRSGGREHVPMAFPRDEAFVAQTCVSLSEALTIARSHVGLT